MKESTAALVGFVIAPIFPGVMLGAMTPVTANGTDLRTVVALFPAGYLVGGLIAAIFGVPMFILLRRLKLIHWWLAVMYGFVIGALVSVALQWPHFQGWPTPILNAGIYGTTGATSAAAFWLVWRQGRQM